MSEYNPFVDKDATVDTINALINELEKAAYENAAKACEFIAAECVQKYRTPLVVDAAEKCAKAIRQIAKVSHG